MDIASVAIGVVNVATAILIIGISMPLVKGKIPMNKLYGIRFKKSYASEENWYKINEYGGKQPIIWSIPLLLFGVLIFFIPLDGNSNLIVMASCAPLIVLVPAVRSYYYAKNL